tara:strand:- start:251005 stop:251706 length:702 start_codon:yes stop_codon:yes gene_type:complete
MMALFLTVFVHNTVWANNSTLFTDMLVIGASVSADHSAPSPGKYVAEQAGLSSSQVVRKAKDGAKSTYFKDYIEDRIPRLTPDIIIAVDLFFHDFKIPAPFRPSDEAHVRDTVSTMAGNSNIFVLGTAIGLQGIGGATQANQLLWSMEAENDSLLVVDINSIFIDLHSFEGYQYDVNGVQMTVFRHHVLADAVHPNPFGSKMLANIIIKELRAKYPEITDNDLPYIPLEAPQF